MFAFESSCILQIKSQKNDLKNDLNCVNFINKLTTNLITPQAKSCTYTCILTAHGRFLMDLFFYQTNSNFSLLQPILWF